MKNFFHSRLFYTISAIVVILIVIIMAFRVSKKEPTILVTATVETGPVRELVSVSGIAKAKQTAELAFPVTGIVQNVLVEKGSKVKIGDSLVTLNSKALYADRLNAVAVVSTAKANLDETLKGLTSSARNVVAESVATREETLETLRITEAQKVENAYHTLLATDLTAYSKDPDEEAVAPTISGTYNCKEEGTYEIEVYSSKTDSGYSYRLTGLEIGTFTASTQQSGTLGSCGLQIQFDEDSNYAYSEWTINIPNIRSSLYVTNRNAYSLAVTQAESAIANAEQALEEALANATNQNSPARDESVIRAEAAVTQAQAQLARIDAEISDRTLTAPFAGIITEIDILPGETVTTAPIVTLLASNAFEVTARIPEIDIGKLSVGQKVEMLFDAKDDEIVTGKISFISLKSTEIDGVAYYEAIIKLDDTPNWIKSGLNADIEIIIEEKTEGLRIPKRFIVETEKGYEVILQKDNGTANTTIEVIMEGNDGFVSIIGLNEGDIVVAP